jgi:hypothetical protein
VRAKAKTIGVRSRTFMGNLCGRVDAPMKIDVGTRRIDDGRILRGRACSRGAAFPEN